jgi:hypothetical protein
MDVLPVSTRSMRPIGKQLPTPGLYAKLGADLVPGPGGKPQAPVRLHTNESDM